MQQTAPEPIVVNPEDVTALNEENGQQASMLIDYVRIYQQGNPDDILESVAAGDEVSFVDDVVYDGSEQVGGGECRYYDMLGRPVSPDATGLVICREGSRVTKILR